VNNVAVPGATVVDLLSNEEPDSSPNTFTQLALGGSTQIETALDASPTFVTIWIGFNNVFGSALAGSDDFVTPPGTFESRYASMLDSLSSAENLQGGVLIGVPNVAFFPILSTGPAYFRLDQQGQFPQNFVVASNCNTKDPDAGLTPIVPLEYGFDLIGQALQNPEQTITLDCEAQGEAVLSLNEVSSLVETVGQYNAVIKQQAQDRGLAYFNPNDVFGALYMNDDGDSDPTNDLIPKFPDRDSDQPFGQFFSLDGFHPSSAAHRVITNRLVETINEKYGTSLQKIEAPSLPSVQSVPRSLER
jgi:hypothetical protein